jgi:hypothetical protein
MKETRGFGAADEETFPAGRVRLNGTTIELEMNIHETMS